MDFAIMESAIVGAGLSAARATQKQRKQLLRRVNLLTNQRNRLIVSKLASEAAIQKAKQGKRAVRPLRAVLGDTQARLNTVVIDLRSAVSALRALPVAGVGSC